MKAVRIPAVLLPKIRLAVIFAFVALCATVFGYLWTNSGGTLPGISKKGYQVSVDFPRVTNLVHDSDVMIAGVKVGKVNAVEVRADTIRVGMRLTDAEPLHEGAVAQIRQKSLVEETFIEITDGKGAPLPSGTRLPAGSGKSLSTLNDVLASLDPESKAALSSSVRSLGAATAGSRKEVSGAFAGLGDVGREGADVLSALEAQSGDLKELAGQTAHVLASLNSRQGQIGAMVSDAHELAKATADGSGDIEQIMRKLPGTLDAAKGASGGISQLSADLGPVARDLRSSAPALTGALRELPATSRDLRGLLPSLDGVLDRAPGTLSRAPAVTQDLSALVPTLRTDLAEINPMLSYLKPYGPDITAFFTNWGQSFANSDVNGHYLRLMLPLDEQTFRGYPLSTNIGPFNHKNPYPAPGSQADPGPSEGGTYPRVEREDG